MVVEMFIWFGSDNMIEIINVRPIKEVRHLLIIDKKMDLYRGKSNEDIAKELIKND